MTARPIQSFWEELKANIVKIMSLRIIAFYSIAAIAFSALSTILPYEVQVHSSIAAGIAVASLLVASTILSHGFLSPLNIVFIGGIIFLLAALFKRGLLPPTTLQNFGHYALALSLALTGSYVVMQILRGNRIRSHAKSVKSFGDFLAISWTTLSSELCYCLHPVPILETLGIMAFMPNQVRIGFVIMATTLLHEARLTYAIHKSKRLQAHPL